MRHGQKLPRCPLPPLRFQQQGMGLDEYQEFYKQWIICIDMTGGCTFGWCFAFIHTLMLCKLSTADIYMDTLKTWAVIFSYYLTQATESVLLRVLKGLTRVSHDLPCPSAGVPKFKSRPTNSSSVPCTICPRVHDMNVLCGHVRSITSKGVLGFGNYF